MSSGTDADRVIIFDTTMRDGEQSPGASMNLSEKLRIAEILERFGEMVRADEVETVRYVGPARMVDLRDRQRSRADERLAGLRILIADDDGAHESALVIGLPVCTNDREWLVDHYECRHQCRAGTSGQ